MRHGWIVVIFGSVFALAASAAPPGERHFLLTQSASVDGLKPGDSVRVWTLVPPTDAQQTVRDAGRTIPSADAADRLDPVSGNTFRSFAAVADASGKLDISNRWEITRHQAAIVAKADPTKLTAALQPDRLVPINGKPMQLLAGRSLASDPMTLGKQIFDVVYQSMEYRKDKPGWGRGDATWACDSHFGNCTDFHSLFISLARSEKLPATFQIGYAIPPDKSEGDIAGYHCWAWFYAAEKGWVPVDISESKQTGVQQFASLDCNRVLLSTGRDLELIPKQAGEPLNFFVDPYVEVNGKPLEKKQVHTHVHFVDISE